MLSTAGNICVSTCGGTDGDMGRSRPIDAEMRITKNALQSTLDYVLENSKPCVISKIEALMRVSYELGKIKKEREILYEREMEE